MVWFRGFGIFRSFGWSIAARLWIAAGKDKTLRLKNNYRVKDGPKGLRFDGLFVDADSPETAKLESEDELALIGKLTYLLPSRSKPGEILSFKAIEYRATCLPFRTRVTDKFVYLHSGEVALRNYDKNPDGNGVIAKSVPAWDSMRGDGE